MVSEIMEEWRHLFRKRNQKIDDINITNPPDYKSEIEDTVDSIELEINHIMDKLGIHY